MRQELRRAQIWTAPLVLALVSAIGLVSALLADGAADVLAWLTLAVPVAVVAWYVLPRAQRGRRRAQQRV